MIEPISEQFLEETWRFNEQYLAQQVESPIDFSSAAATIRTRETLHAPAVEPEEQGLPIGVEELTIDSGPHPVPVRIFRPENPRAVYLTFHMGGWVVGSARSADSRNSHIAQECSVAVVSVDYRLAPEWHSPAQIEDAMAVASWIFTDGESEFGTSRILLGGESAGATLAVLLLLALREGGLGIDRIVGVNLAYGVYDFSGTPSHRSSDAAEMLQDVNALVYPDLKGEQLRDPKVSPLYADLHSLPPAHFTVGTADGLLDDSLFMAARWQAAGNTATIRAYPDSLHAFDTFPTKIAELACRSMDDFIKSSVVS